MSFSAADFSSYAATSTVAPLTTLTIATSTTRTSAPVITSTEEATSSTRKSSTTLQPTTTFPTFTATKSATLPASTNAGELTSSSSLSTGAKAGIGVGIFVVLALLVAIGFCTIKRRRPRQWPDPDAPAMDATNNRPEIKVNSSYTPSHLGSQMVNSGQSDAGTKYSVNVESRNVPEQESLLLPLHARNPLSRENTQSTPSETRTRPQRRPLSANLALSSARESIELEEKPALQQIPSLPSPTSSEDLDSLRAKHKSLQESIDAMENLHRLQAEQAQLQERIRLAEERAALTLAGMNPQENGSVRSA